MRDVIVIGSGAGGAVVAKELAARGLDVMVLEAGPHHTDSERDFTHFEIDQNSAFNGVFRFGPADRTRQAWARELPQHSAIGQIAGVGGTTLHYLGNSPRAMPGAFEGFRGPNPDAYDREHLFPFTYEELIPYYEWVEETLPVQTAAMGVKEEIFLNAAESIGLRHQTSRTWCATASGRRKTPSCSRAAWRAGRTTRGSSSFRSRRAAYSAATASRAVICRCARRAT
jgi:choline dehydrogenase-like flavoprotein